MYNSGIVIYLSQISTNLLYVILFNLWKSLYIQKINQNIESKLFMCDVSYEYIIENSGIYSWILNKNLTATELVDVNNIEV